eukprot:CAMPEP_0177746752 /NCGR_PEP_ID=MMETSP0484_2-20121128/31034_1 /TAXON_ID=354590 /ORGANISM="Rhodomonas lens, Strain RHODO" /LENGTH=136 /DNA_ID=CAMNT_0019261517 /DNA_START=279 /DNA_END=686 /DNA_ORIENTATION=+
MTSSTETRTPRSADCWRSRRGISFLSAHLLFAFLLVPRLAEAQQCGMIDQVKECREDCGSCGAAACCTLEWELPDTNSTEFAAQMVSLLRRGGPDNLFRLEGHLVNYKEWATDLYDDSPRNIQAVHAPKEFAANNQ